MKRTDRERQANRDDFMSSDLGDVWPVLRTGIWHTTSVLALRSIRRDGFIHANEDLKHPASWPGSSERSYGRTRGMVCLFDFASASEDDCFAQSATWRGFFARHDPVTVAIELDRDGVSANLVANEVACAADPHCVSMWIPYVEAWHRGQISTRAIVRYGFRVVTGQRNEWDYRRDWKWYSADDEALDDELDTMAECCERWHQLDGTQRSQLGSATRRSDAAGLSDVLALAARSANESRSRKVFRSARLDPCTHIERQTTAASAADAAR